MEIDSASPSTSPLGCHQSLEPVQSDTGLPVKHQHHHHLFAPKSVFSFGSATSISASTASVSTNLEPGPPSNHKKRRRSRSDSNDDTDESWCPFPSSQSNNYAQTYWPKAKKRHLHQLSPDADGFAPSSDVDFVFRGMQVESSTLNQNHAFDDQANPLITPMQYDSNNSEDEKGTTDSITDRSSHTVGRCWPSLSGHQNNHWPPQEYRSDKSFTKHVPSAPSPLSVSTLLASSVQHRHHPTSQHTFPNTSSEIYTMNQVDTMEVEDDRSPSPSCSSLSSRMSSPSAAAAAMTTTTPGPSFHHHPSRPNPLSNPSCSSSRRFPSPTLIDHPQTPKQRRLEHSTDPINNNQQQQHRKQHPSPGLDRSCTPPGGKQMLQFTLGFRNDCELCTNKTPGHYSHIVHRRNHT